MSNNFVSDCPPCRNCGIRTVYDDNETLEADGYATLYHRYHCPLCGCPELVKVGTWPITDVALDTYPHGGPFGVQRSVPSGSTSTVASSNGS